MRKSQITIGALLSYGAIIFNIVAGLLYTPWMIRTIGDDLYALYTLAMSVISLFLVDFGVGASVSKFLSGYYAKGLKDEANRFLGIVFRVFFLISAVIAVVLLTYFFGIDRIYANLTDSEIQVFKRLYIIVAIYSVLSFPCTTFNGILLANEEFIALKACNFGLRVLNVLLIVVFLLLDGSVYVLVLVHAATNVLACGFKYIWIRKKTTGKADLSCKDRTMTKSLLGFSAWNTVIMLAQRCIFNIMPTVIAALIGSEEVTVFSLAATLEGYVFTFADAVNGMFMPEISRLIAKDEEEGLPRLMNRVGRFHVYTIGLLFIGFLLVGKHFVLLWMGEGYELVYTCAVLLIFPSLIDVPQQIAKSALLATDHVKEQAIVFVAMAVCNLVLSLVLIPLLGIVGATLAICISYLLRTLGLNCLYKRFLGLRLGTYFRNTYSRWILAAIGTIAVGSVVPAVLPSSGWFSLLLQCVIIAGVYCILLVLVGLKKNERKTLIRLIKRR